MRPCVQWGMWLLVHRAVLLSALMLSGCHINVSSASVQANKGLLAQCYLGLILLLVLAVNCVTQLLPVASQPAERSGASVLCSQPASVMVLWLDKF